MDTEELTILKTEYAHRKEYEPLRFFKPNLSQERFINAVADPESKTILFPAGVWCGKTAAAMATLAACIWPDQAEHPVFNKPLFKAWDSFGYPRQARIVSTPKELENIGSIQREIVRWWPKGKYTIDKKGKQFYSEFRSNTGWIIDLMSYEQGVPEFEGATIPFFIFNEPCPEDIYDACIRRKKYGGKITMPMTPLANSAWIYDRLVAHDGENGIRIVYGETEDNCKDHKPNGVLPHQAIVDLENALDPDDREACLHGKFSHLAGQIFKSFTREAHVIDDLDLEQFLPGKQIYQVVDPAIGKPLAVIWAAVSEIGEITIYDESPHIEFQGARDSNMTVLEYANAFKAQEGHYRPAVRILDRHFGNQRRTMGGLTLKQEFGDVGIDFDDSYTIGDNASEVETGILKVKDLLRYNKDKPLSNLNSPRLKIFKSCYNTIHALERWSRDPKTGKPKEEYKDFADNVRYLAMAGPEVMVERPWEVTPAVYRVV